MKEAYLPLPAHEPRARRGAGPAVGAGFVAVVAACGWLALRQPRPAVQDAPALPPERGPLAQEQAPVAPAAQPPVELPRSVEASAAPLPALSGAAPLMKAELAAGRALAAAPAWARATPELRWSWPARVMGISIGLPSRGSARRPGMARRIAGWFPSHPAGEQVQLSVIGGDGAEAKIYEADAAAFDAQHQAKAIPGIGALLAAMMRGGGGAAGAVTAMTREQLIAAAREHHEQSMKTLRQRAGVVGVKDVSPEGQMVGDFELTYRDGHKETIRYDPLVFDLRGRGVQTDDRKVLFDLYGYHKTDKVQWMNDVADGMGILVFDPRGTGTSGGTGAEVFGDRTDLNGAGKATGFADGFEALRGLVDQAVARGVLSREAVDGGVLDAQALSALEKAYGLKMKVGGFNKQAISLSEAGVSAIALSNHATRRVEDFDGRRNDILLQEGAVFLRADGTTGHYMNVWLTAKTGGVGLGK